MKRKDAAPEVAELTVRVPQSLWTAYQAAVERREGPARTGYDLRPIRAISDHVTAFLKAGGQTPYLFCARCAEMARRPYVDEGDACRCGGIFGVTDPELAFAQQPEPAGEVPS